MNQKVMLLATNYEHGFTRKDWMEVLNMFNTENELIPVEFHLEGMASYYGFFDSSIGEDGYWKRDIHNWLRELLVHGGKGQSKRYSNNEYNIIEYTPNEEVTIVLYHRKNNS